MNLKQRIENTVHSSWQPIVMAAITKMDASYLNTLEQQDDWIPERTNIFNAFRQPKEQVRFVMLGESPYPRAQSANGYAFWDAQVGELWSEKGLSKAVNRATSLRNFIKMLLHAEGLLASPFFAHDISVLSKQGLISSIDALFNKLLSHGFLLLNASLIWSNDLPVRYHARHWYPFIHAIFESLEDQEVKYLLFGKVAEKFKYLPQQHCLITEHPYVLSFIENPAVLDFFKPLSLLRV